ncbi:MAG: FecR family protein [Deltaproteobacteria bacterium]|nr:FecR family protein [Deltaproteobacteria bacterium]
MKTNTTILFLGLFIGLLLLIPTVEAQEAPKVLKIAGKAEILQKGRWLKAKTGHELLVGQAIRLVKGKELTLISDGGQIEIVVSDGGAIKYNGQVPERSVPWGAPKVVSSKSDLTRQIQLLEGTTHVTVTNAQPLRVITPLVIAAVRGTDFSVKVEPDGSSTITVRDGSVLAIGRTGQTEMVEAGSSFQITAEQYARYLKRQKVKIPPEGWKQIPDEEQEALDSKTFKSGIPGRAVHRTNRSTNKNNNNNNNNNNVKLKNLS